MHELSSTGNLPGDYIKSSHHLSSNLPFIPISYNVYKCMLGKSRLFCTTEAKITEVHHWCASIRSVCVKHGLIVWSYCNQLPSEDGILSSLCHVIAGAARADPNAEQAPAGFQKTKRRPKV
jgi:hypothetical protein